METQHTPPIPGKGPRIHTIAVISAVFLLVTIAAFAVGLAIGSKVKEVTSNDDVPEVTNTDDSEVETPEDDEPVAVAEEYTGDAIAIDWYGANDERLGVFNPELKAAIVAKYGQELIVEFSAQKLGIAENGSYAGYELVANTVVTSGMGDTAQTVFLFEKGEDWIALAPYCTTSFFRPTGYYSGFGDCFNIDVPLLSYHVAELEYSETLTSSNGKYAFNLVGPGIRLATENVDETDYPYIMSTSEGEALRLFTADRSDDEWNGLENAYFFVNKEGRVVWYDLAVPFWTGSAASGVPMVVIDGKTNTQTYVKGSIGGCGFSAITHVVSDVPELKQIGYMVGNESVKIYASKEATPEEADFEYPFFYYQDALGRWVKFTLADVAPAGECGKPVIYLYPETTTDITVHVAPEGGFSITEPEYGEGWEVTASPDGTLVNKVDGKMYPYLFWEGRGGLYAEPQYYWVVARADVHAFLVDTLAEVGLNEKETADFLEFWEPRMQAAPYYKIGFHGNTVMDALAPMDLSQEADTIVRVLMDYSELAAPITPNEPTLPATPIREGFTVIEWGGVLR